MARLNVPDVPYQAYPSEVPQGQLPSLSVRTDPAAFGANVATAVEHFGGTLGHVGDELFSRAIQIKQVQNETEANNAINAFMDGSGERTEKFKEKLGADAAPALKPYISDLDAFQQKIRSGLSNPAVQRAFDSGTRGVRRQYISQASGHAATQANHSLLQTLDAKDKLNMDRLEKAPENSAVWDEVREDQIKNGFARKQAQGWTDDVRRLHDQQQLSEALKVKARGISNTDPEAGDKFLEEHRHEMLSHDYDLAKEHGESRLTNVVGRNTSAAVNAFPQGKGAGAWITQDQLNILNSVDSNASRVFNAFSINHPEFRAQPTSGDIKSLDYMVQGDTAASAKALQEAADQEGIKILIEHDEDSVHFTLDPSQDPKEIPAEIPEDVGARAGRAQAEVAERYKDYPRMPAAAFSRAHMDFRQIEATKRSKENQAQMAVWDLISPEGQPKAHNEDELLHRINERYGNTKIYDNLNGKQKNMFRRVMSSPDHMGDDTAEYLRMDRIPEYDLAAMNPMDIAENDKLTRGSKLRLITKWKKAVNAPEGNPKTNQAMQLIRADQPNSPIWDDADRRNHLRQLIQDRIMYETDVNKKPVSPKELIEMGRRMMQTVHMPGMLWGTNDYPMFEVPVTSKDIERGRADKYWDGKPAPTEDDIVRRIEAARYQMFVESGGQALTPQEPVPAPVTRPEEPIQAPRPPLPARATSPVSVPSDTGAFLGGERQPGKQLTESAIAEQEREIAGRQAAQEEYRRRVAASRGGVGKPAAPPRAGLAEYEAAQTKRVAEQNLNRNLDLLERQEAQAKSRMHGVRLERELARIERERKALKGE